MLCEDVPRARALLILNKYTGMLWDRRKGRVKGNIMELSGADWDRGHVLDWACNVFEEIQDETIENATIENIKKHLTPEATAGLAMLLVHLQGHGSLNPNIYITADGHYENSNIHLQGLWPRKLISLLSNLDCDTWKIVVGDFCHSGNFMILRYALEIDEQGPRWVETPEWEGLDLETRSKQGTAPILYLAGCTTQESAYEDRQTGGYCTKGLTSFKGQNLTLPLLQVRIQEYVTNALRNAKDSGSRLQTPQFYSNVKLALDDSDFLREFQYRSLSYTVEPDKSQPA